MSKYRIKINGIVYEMEIEFIDESSNDKTSKNKKSPYVTYRQSSDAVVRVISPNADKQIHDDDSIVSSPMPGTIIKELVKVGDIVAKGEPVLVLEAMKMENEICAQKSGKVKAIFVKTGETVLGDTPLFEICMEEK